MTSAKVSFPTVQEKVNSKPFLYLFYLENHTDRQHKENDDILLYDGSLRSGKVQFIIGGLLKLFGVYDVAC